RLRLDRDLVSVPYQVGRDIHTLAVDQNMAVIDELARGEHRRDEFHAIDDRVQAPLEQLDQPLAGIAPAPRGLDVIFVELALGDVAVIALELLFGGELDAEVGRLSAALAVLPGTVFALVDRALRPAPEIDPEAAVDLVL